MSETRDRFTCASADAAPEPCAWDGCAAAGQYRAPKDRNLSAYLMFCLEHVRAYNAQWDFHAGCANVDMEAEIRSAATWERPTWKLGTLGPGGAGFRTGRASRVKDPFGFAAGTAFDDRTQARAEEAQARSAPGGAPAWTKAAKLLGLKGPITLDGAKRRYKELVKTHHPDANGGSAEAEKRMKQINEAYQILRAGLTG